jgi:hypothetical protein
VSWVDVQDIKLKLFEVQLLVKDEWISINLEKLSDDNLKLVKSSLGRYQKRFEEKARVAVTA